MELLKLECVNIKKFEKLFLLNLLLSLFVHLELPILICLPLLNRGMVVVILLMYIENKK
nr:MAG TPA: hypothetical protein [Crassvirales sp.]